MAPDEITIALDWSPNTLHTGIYTALARDFYADAGLSVTISPPSATYPTTPAKQLQNGAVDLAIVPSESCIAYAESGAMKLQAIYAILQKDASAVVALRDVWIKELKDLGKGKYGSYNARYEDGIVRAMVTRAGGDGAGMQVVRDQGKLGLFAALKEGEVDATWVFLPWEGVQAEMEGWALSKWQPGEELGPGYGYSPVIARDAEGKVSEDVLRRFLQATRRGYEQAVVDAKGAVANLEAHCGSVEKGLLQKSQEVVNGFYGGEGKLGSMDGQRWEDWVAWLKKEGLVKGNVDSKSLFTNEFFT